MRETDGAAVRTAVQQQQKVSKHILQTITSFNKADIKVCH